MIDKITEKNFPSYATLHQATVNDADMGDKTIESQVKIDGQIKPDFSFDWMIKHDGHHYIQPLREPEASKENTSVNLTADLTFQHWAIYKLKQKYFFQYTALESGTSVPDKWVASVSMNLGDFVDYLKPVLKYWYGDTITVELNPDWDYDEEAIFVSISYTYIWDLLQKLYDYYEVRWEIVPTDDCTDDNPKYVIRIGYDATEVNHIFEYGFEGGLLKVARQVQSSDIKNEILGRGGDKNLPYRYFKDIDEDNPSFAADPDWVPELRNTYFAELRGKTYRDYIKGWKTNPNRQLTETDGTPITPYGSTTPIAVEPYDSEYAATSWAYQQGHGAERFDPIEFVADNFEVKDGKVVVKDGSSIAKYGEILGALDNNDDIYPTIQGIYSAEHPSFFKTDIGRVDQVIAVEQTLTDDIEDATVNDAVLTDIGEIRATVKNVSPNTSKKVTTIGGQTITVKAGEYVTLTGTEGGCAYKSGSTDRYNDYYANGLAEITKYTITAINTQTNREHTPDAIPEGTWNIQVEFTVKNNTSDTTLDITARLDSIQAASSKAIDKWTNKFDIWIKNIWASEKLSSETALEYASRIWDPIMGDRWGNEAKVIFSSGLLSTSEDYEFTMLSVEYDTSKTLAVWGKNGKVVATYQSEWKITLAKSDADYDSLGVYIPSVERQGQAGDYFFFTGIELPHAYVVWAEDDIDAWKQEDGLDEYANIKPTWVVSLDKVRVNTLQQKAVAEYVTLLIDAIKPGALFRLADNRFIEGAYERLYIQSVTTTYEEGKILPNVEITLSDQVAAVTSTTATMQSNIEAINKQLGSISNLEQIVRVVGDKLYLRKDGIEDLSLSPTSFASLVKSRGFRQGMVGGAGWGFYQDENGNWVFEIDKINARQDFNVNNFVVNQVSVMGGKEISSAANITIDHVVEATNGFMCYFDTKLGTVANLFEVDDVAFSEVYDADNNMVRFYKRKVIAVGNDYVTLSRAISNGSGVPQQGDVAAQYGNYTNAERRFVKVRDVIGGAYEMYIEGLDSVTATGTEYYFVGKKSGDTYRFFIGNKDSQYLEWYNGNLNIKGNLIAHSTIDGKAMGEYINDSGRNLVLRSTTQTGSSRISTYALSRELTVGETYTLSIWCTDTQTAQDYAASLGKGFLPWIGDVAKVQDGLYRTTFVMTAYKDSETDKQRLNVEALLSAKLIIDKIKLEVGDTGTEWSAAPEDTQEAIDSLNEDVASLDYLKEAMKQNTVIGGGLILSSLIKMGSNNTVNADGTVSQGTTWSGINGVYNGDDTPVVWGGGDMIDAEKAPDDDSAAQWMLRMDGTGYFVGGLVRLIQGAMALGKNLQITDKGLSLVDDNGRECFLLSNDAIAEASTYYSNSSEHAQENISDAVTVAYNSAMCQIYGGIELTTDVDVDAGRTLNLGVTAWIDAPEPPNVDDIYSTPTLAVKAVFTPDSGDTEVLLDSVVRTTYGSDGKYRITVNVTMDKHDVSGVVRCVVAPTSAVYPTQGVSTIATTLNAMFDYTVFTAYQPMVQVFNNGFVACNANTVMYSGSDAALMRYDNYGVLLDANGLQITNDGFDTRKKFNFNKLQFE